jgi:hypothetical protein
MADKRKVHKRLHVSWTFCFSPPARRSRRRSAHRSHCGHSHKRRRRELPIFFGSIPSTSRWRRQSCDLLARQNDLELRYCILRDIVVTYSRPFSKNLGRVYRKHALPEDVVPAAMRGLHTELLKLRDQAFAHTDHDFRNPQIARFPREGGGGVYSMSFRNPSYEDLNTRLPEIRVRI